MSLSENSLCESPRSEDVSMEDLILKKVWFREKDDSSKEAGIPDSSLAPTVSWKDKLIGTTNKGNKDSEDEDDIEVLNGEIQTSTVNGTLSIDFLDRIFQILLKDMDNNVVIKLLGRSIGSLCSRAKYIVFGSYLLRST